MKKAYSDFHIISHSGMWGVFKKGSVRSMRNFKHRELAFLYASGYKTKIIIHETDGSVCFIFNNELKD